MAYPLPSDFTATESDPFNPPAWWTYSRDDGSRNVCAGTGGSVVRQVRVSAGLPSGSTWDDALQAALVAKARSFAALQPGSDWRPLIAALQADAASRAVGDASLRFGIWVGFYQTEGLRLDAVGLSPGTVRPAWGRPAPDGPGGDAIVCFDPDRDPNPSVMTDGQLADAIEGSTTGLRLRPGEHLPSPLPPAPPAGPGGVSNWALLGIGAAALVAVGVVVTMNRKAATPPRGRPR